MTRVAAIVEAVKNLPPEEQHELLEQLGSILGAPEVLSAGNAPPGIPPDFTQRLVEHFHRAKQAALSGGR